jgi:outer membrane biosynthesis protein TonB
MMRWCVRCAVSALFVALTACRSPVGTEDPVRAEAAPLDVPVAEGAGSAPAGAGLESLEVDPASPEADPESSGGEAAEEVESAEAVAEVGLIARFAGERPRLRSRPVPVFPAYVDLESLIPGWVEFRVRIDEEGRVLEVELLEASAPALEEPARTAQREARYEPVRDPRGMPIRVWFRERIEF